MHARISMFALLLLFAVIALTGCGGSSEPTPTPTKTAATSPPEPLPTDTPQVVVLPTNTPISPGTAIPAPTDTPIPVIPTDTPAPSGAVANASANLRGGPGTDYDVVGQTQPGQALAVVARSRAGDWYRLDDGAWIAAFLVDNAPINLSIIDVATPVVVQPPATAVPVIVQPTAIPVVVQPAPAAVCGCASDSYNCPAFTTQNEAQACFNYCVSQGVGDIHKLDGNDADGLACESLP